MPLVKVLKCVVAEKFSRRVRRNGEVVVNGVVMDAVGPSRGGDRAPGAGAGERSGASSSPKPKGDFLQLFVNEDIKDEKLRESILSLAPKTRIIITEVMKYDSSCRLTPKSKMMTKVSAFSYAREDLDEYVKPPLVSVAEAKGSPKKRRLSLEVGECAVTSTYKRRSLWMEGGGSTIEVVLWGEAAEQKVFPASNVRIHALVKEDRRLSSTSSTTFEMPDLMDDRGTIIGIGDIAAGFPVEVILEDGCLLHVGDNVGVDLEAMELPVNVQYKASNGVVHSMDILVDSVDDV